MTSIVTSIANRPLTLAGNYLLEKSNPQVPCLSWNDISIVASHRIVSHLSDSVTNVDLNASFSSTELRCQDQVYLCLSPVADPFEPRNATMPAGVPAVSVHLGRAPLVPCRNPIQNVFFWGLRERLSDYPSSGGGPNTSRPRAIFTTIVQL
ncbi:hypothetical protein HYE67_003699 [Fusarium culmorum]|uniref:Uncharacterized protein n=1 Tax=Fusarium culmorum TaxID=5516 RepID=A0A2T4GIV5_FUSCU|nr:hypothetical protein FCULG_00000853 [Fusarium culmorum]QPC61468.1 hypothetical protein HYE67_003699 [Fusarium culmorum]